MGFGQYQLQLFVSLVVILAAAIVALICDVLRRNNQELREINIELEIRSRLLTSHVAEAKPGKIATPEAAPALAHMAVSKEPRTRTVNSEAVAAMERGAALAGCGKHPPEPDPAVIAVSEALLEKPNPAKKDWGSLLSRNAQASNLSLPTGFQAGFQNGRVLSELVRSRQPISGLVVSIGVNASRKSDGSLPESVTELVQSLIGPNDFAAQSSDDEFLLIYPGEQGASAQRRLSRIAQQLWDFQLRSLGSFQILFSWGGVEVRSESIEEAIASASERMQETKRGRKLLTMSSPAQPVETNLRKAV